MKISKRFLCCLLALCLLLTLVACGGSADPDKIDVPEVAEDGSADENIHEAYQIGLEQLCRDGADYAEMGLTYPAGYCYSTALSGAASLQMTACALLGDVSDLAYPDWYAASCITRASPYPAFFQGLLCEFKGDEMGAADFYRQAELYYEFPESLYAFRYLKDASAGELEKTKKWCEELIADISEVYSPSPYARELGELDFMAGYHQAMGDAYAEQGDYAEALSCYDMALRVNPFETANYIACAAVALDADSLDAAMYLSEGLVFDPQDAGLNLVSAVLFAAEGEREIAQFYIETAREDEAITEEQLTIANELERWLKGAS